MPWTTPVAPVSLTTITRAWAIANIIEPLIWLKTQYGADPGSADWFLQSTGAGVAAWANRAVAANGSSFGYFARNSSGTVKNIASIDASNNLLLGHPDAAATFLYAPGGTVFIHDGTNIYTLQHTGNAPPGVPSGLIAAFANAASIAAGWTRFTNGDGRLLVGAGTTFSQTFVEGASAGSSWGHVHDGSTLATAGASGGAVTSGGGSTASPTGHTHAISGNTASTSWIPPTFAVVWASKT